MKSLCLLTAAGDCMKTECMGTPYGFLLDGGRKKRRKLHHKSAAAQKAFVAEIHLSLLSLLKQHNGFLMGLVEKSFTPSLEKMKLYLESMPFSQPGRKKRRVNTCTFIPNLLRHFD